MEIIKICDGFECADKCNECDTYQSIKLIMNHTKQLYKSLITKDPILEEIKECNDIIMLEKVIKSLEKERHAGTYSYTIEKIQERIRQLINKTN